MKGGIFIFKCPLCGNEDEKFIGYRNGVPYCRRCISFRGEEALDIYSKSTNGFLYVQYKLTDEQNRVSNQVLENYKNGLDTLIYAVCGAGKTELVYKVMEYCLAKKMNVGFAIARRDVVIELSERLKQAFKNYKVVSLYGGHTSELEGDIICLTTHQLYRFEKYFDLLIIDEIDAFPFNGNFALEAFFHRSVRGHYVMMSATPSKERIEEFKRKGKAIVNLFKRHHGKPIPVPKFFIAPKFVTYFYLVYKVREIIKKNLPLLVFAPTIEECENLFVFLNIFAKDGYFVHSKCKDRSKIIEDFRENKYKYLVTTAVLERGVTLRNLQVIIFNASSFIYTSEALVQISGRVGRVKDATDGEVIFIAERKTKYIIEARETIIDANKSL